MQVTLAEGVDPITGLHEFYFVGLDTYEDFEACLDLLRQRAELQTSKGSVGIWSRACEFESGGFPGSLLYHEDVGVYLVARQVSAAAVQRIQLVAQQIAHDLNQFARGA